MYIYESENNPVGQSVTEPEAVKPDNDVEKLANDVASGLILLFRIFSHLLPLPLYDRPAELENQASHAF